MGKNKYTNEKEKKVAYSISDNTNIPNVNDKKGLNLENDSSKFIVIVLFILAVIGMLWLVDALKSNKNEEEEKEVTPKIQYSEVIVGNMLDQKYDEYYVIAYKEKENKKELIDYLLSKHLTGEHYYTIDLTKAQNLVSVADESNFKSENIGEIKFKDTTLLEIKKGKITNNYESVDKIVDYLKSLEEKNK